MFISVSPSETLRDIYKEMESATFFRDYYSAALSPLQIKFVSHVPPKVKNLIRLMKFWKKTDFEVSIILVLKICLSNYSR